jgi:hypothetical protein
MDTLIVILIVGLATAFSTEFIGSLNFTPFDTRTIKSWATIPLVFIYHWVLGTSGGMMFIGGLASAFISLTVVVLVTNIDTGVTEIRRGRRG